ncbi:hypothetical protein PybrP1_011647 [[Pythium] brassicae (nom. inval.)]|nr:hypothetical protein PybrP1_011647 [[Pythium] brassicae (nom. inval.)]
MLRCRRAWLARRRCVRRPLLPAPIAQFATASDAFPERQQPATSATTTTTSTPRDGDAFAVDTLPALKVLSETFALMKQSPAFRNWNASDWLMGLTVLAQHNTRQRRKRNVLSVLSDDANKKALENQELVRHLLKYVRLCDAVYASTLSGFCQEAGVAREAVVRHHSGGVFSPKFVLLLDTASREIVVVVRGSASIMDFCTDLCLVNEPFLHGQGHRGMVHAANWLARNLQADLAQLTAAYPDYRVVTTGHSLGASVAALTAMLLKPAFPSVQCFAFATPASVTRELAHACADFVTTVVNGDDCVPRLHQHSIFKLQGEVSSFDWRNTLKQLVTDEVAEQKSIATRQRDEKIAQIYAAIRKFEALSLRQQNEAIEKIDQIKRLATENITEFSNEIDRLVTASIDSTLSAFRADKISASRVKFIQNILQADDKQKLPFLWEKLDDSVVTLERLSAAVNKPEELERLIRESKKLLKHTSSATRRGAATLSNAANSPMLALFRDRINSVIDAATESLKSNVKGKMTQVTETVASNVTGYVETVKVEADAISARIQDEIDAAQREITESAESFVAVVQSAPADTVNSVDSMFQDLKAEGVGLLRLFRDGQRTVEVSVLDVDEYIDDEDDEVADDDAAVVEPLYPGIGDDDNDSDAASALAEASRSSEPLHDPLFPPGRILYLNRVAAPESQSSETSASPPGEDVELVEVGNDEFSRVVLSNKMILDHLCTAYERMLQATRILPPSDSDSETAAK